MLSRIIRRILSVPIFVKTLGIGALVACVFGFTIFLSTRASLSRSLYDALRHDVITEAEMLAAQLARPMSIHDVVEIQKIISERKAKHSDLAFIIIRDADSGVLSHSYDGRLPDDLTAFRHPGNRAGGAFRVLDAGKHGLIYESTCPVVKGYAGFVQIGLTDVNIRKQIGDLASSILAALSLSVALGVGLAILLSYALTRPIRELKEAATEIQRGDFGARAEVYSDDEIGKLARAFNAMASSLHQYRGEVDNKEKMRIALLERIVSSHEDERKLIARELHDQLGHSLLAMLMELRMLSPQDEPSGEAVRKLENDLGNVMDELDHIIHGLRPAILDDYGLDEALGSYVTEAAGRFSIDISYQHTVAQGLPRLSDAEELAFYRIAQESITNIVKHAKASHVSVVLIRSTKETTMLVEDDGCGFDRTKVKGTGGLGLIGMQERIALVGGEFDIDSTICGGTSVQARLSVAV